MRGLFARGLEKCFNDWFSVYFTAHKTQRQDFSEGGGWQVAPGRWQVAGDGWRVAGSGWWVTGGGWRVTGDGWLVTGGKESKYCNLKTKIRDQKWQTRFCRITKFLLIWFTFPDL